MGHQPIASNLIGMPAQVSYELNNSGLNVARLLM